LDSLIPLLREKNRIAASITRLARPYLYESGLVTPIYKERPFNGSRPLKLAALNKPFTSKVKTPLSFNLEAYTMTHICEFGTVGEGLESFLISSLPARYLDRLHKHILKHGFKPLRLHHE